MIVHAEAGAARVEQWDDLKGFKLVAHTPAGDLTALAAALTGAGRVADGAWFANFDKMLDFAKSRNWYDAATRAIRAHIEWAQ